VKIMGTATKDRPALRVAQYKALPIPGQLEDHPISITVTKDHYTYQPETATSFDFWVNFADPHLFRLYDDHWFAQDEVQTMEMPGLAATLEMLKIVGGKHITNIVMGGGDGPAPVTVINAERWFSIDTSGGLYGNLRSHTPDQFVAKCTLQNPPQIAHILAITALDVLAVSKPGAEYTVRDIEATFAMVFRGFMQAKLEAVDAMAATKTDINSLPAFRVVVHTGNWGCGAFGGNHMMTGMIQMAAARAADVDLHFHAGNDRPTMSAAAEYEKAKDEMANTVWPSGGAKSRAEVVKALEALKLTWNKGDGK